ncbi:MAG: hypothetical protein MZV64_18880 [Ignavibacteriales bacterium]|nr:hypothetical protein [Ignavibacteriales bacterium]
MLHVRNPVLEMPDGQTRARTFRRVHPARTDRSVGRIFPGRVMRASRSARRARLMGRVGSR